MSVYCDLDTVISSNHELVPPARYSMLRRPDILYSAVLTTDSMCFSSQALYLMNIFSVRPQKPRFLLT